MGHQSGQVKFAHRLSWRTHPGSACALCLAACLFWVAALPGQAQPILTLTAANDIAGTVRIDVLRWSTDAERAELMKA